MSPRSYLRRLAAFGAGLLMLTALGCWALFYYQHDIVVSLMFVLGGLYAAAGWFVLRKEPALSAVEQRRALLLVLGVAFTARVMLLVPAPVSTDIYRYVWDGRMQAASINPYRFVPADPRLARFQDEAIFSYINRADSAVTIYPPLAQMIFLAVTRVGENVTVMKGAMICFDLVTIGALFVLLSRRGLPGTRLLLYAWHPLPLFEFAASGHIDAAAIALMMLALLVAERRRPAMAGMLLGAAAAVKFFPLAVAPMLYRRWDWRFPVALVLTIALLYIPYLGVGWQVLGFLPGYLATEGMVQVRDSGYFILEALQATMAPARWMLPAYLIVAAGILGSIALASLLRRSEGLLSMPAALWLLAAFTILISPHLAWYFTWIIPFFCFRFVWALLYLTLAAPFLYANLWTNDPLTLQSLLYVPCAIVGMAALYFQHRRSNLEFSDDRGLRPRHAR